MRRLLEARTSPYFRYLQTSLSITVALLLAHYVLVQWAAGNANVLGFLRLDAPAWAWLPPLAVLVASATLMGLAWRVERRNNATRVLTISVSEDHYQQLKSEADRFAEVVPLSTSETIANAIVTGHLGGHPIRTESEDS